MAEKGVLEASQMAGTFDMLRANDLIFSYVVSNWLMGQEPPAFDILAWNGDSTRMPSAMHSFYLRSLYMRNELARGELELLGQQLSLSSVTSDTYVVGAINDHIVPWHGSYKTVGLMGGNVRYVARDAEGKEYTTFREEIGERAKKLTGSRVRIAFHEEQRGQYTNVYLDKLEPEEPAGTDGDTDPQEAAWRTAVDAAPWLVGEPGKPVGPEELYEKLKPFEERVAEDIEQGERESSG